MWCFLKHENEKEFIEQYPELENDLPLLTLFKNDTISFFPRYLYTQYPSPLLYIHEKPQIFDEINLKFNGTLRDNQKPIVNFILNLYKQNNQVNGILKAVPGIGKTVMSVYLASKLKLKTIIIVDNTTLLTQWINAFTKFTNITSDEIAIFKQQLFKTDTSITIAMIQTLTRRLKVNMKKTYDIIDENKFGLVIYDEVHNTSSAAEFAKGSLLFTTKNVLGLSATPFQTGISELLMKHTIGNVIYESTEYELIPHYKFIYYESNISNKYVYLINKSSYEVSKAIYNKAIIEQKEYLDLILTYTKYLLSAKHKIIIICFTRKQVEIISEMLTQNNIENTMFYGIQKKINYTENILVATYSFAGKGFDYAELSGMILACPLAGKKSIIQTVGRILREYKGKTSPEVIDLVDLTLPSMFLREMKIKKNIVSAEFKCQITDAKFGV